MNSRQLKLKRARDAWCVAAVGRPLSAEETLEMLMRGHAVEVDGVMVEVCRRKVRVQQHENTGAAKVGAREGQRGVAGIARQAATFPQVGAGGRCC
jgi:hypothetical protein